MTSTLLHDEILIDAHQEVASGKSLSDYFPPETTYFYGYPAGSEAGFLNNVPPAVEELVAARTFSCAGPNVRTVAFAATCAPNVSKSLLNRLHIPQATGDDVLVLPSSIDHRVHGIERDHAIKAALNDQLKPHSFVMAQPFMDTQLVDKYRINPNLSLILNDKKNLCNYLDDNYTPRRLAEFASGSAFVASQSSLSLPYVAKASSSSSGDGVCICLTEQDAVAATKKLGVIKDTVIVEQYIDAVRNFGVHFGIPSDPTKPIDILGINEQITTPEGEFLGGTITSTVIPEVLQRLCSYLRNEALEQVRSMGWFGVGGFDVLVDSVNNTFIIDCNFRMTGMTAYHFLVGNDLLRAPLVTFSGTFTGSQNDLEQAASTVSESLQIIALSSQGDTWSFNAALQFKADPHDAVRKLQSLDIRSAGLEAYITQ